ncbi:hypothetical protein [Kordia jejudonensis]|uniref:hypothetical protein n=1 Tax=Kordia jejudonensis TaxID=1348245 RepID=UPI00062943FD|nr:hypothetical protein [Kordia jejudonensis]
MDIVNILTLQLTKIENLLKNDLQKKSIIYNFLVNDNDNFISYFKLQSFVLNNECKNIEALKNINQKCTNIVELWNIDLDGLPYKIIKNGFNYFNEDGTSGVVSETDFHTISTLENDGYWQLFSTIYGKKHFIKNYSFKNFSINQIVSRCINIINLIENQFPKAIVDFSCKYYLDHYHTTGNFDLQSKL